jgi:hypothetical protein
MKTMNQTVSDFMDSYAQCSIEDFRGLTTDEIAALILTLNPDEGDAQKMAQAVVDYLAEPDPDEITTNK